MDEQTKVNTGTQYDATKDDSTQTMDVPDAEVTKSILELANMFLHSSYWFLMLSITLNRLDLSGMAWAAKQKDIFCRESAMTIMSEVLDMGGRVELADIAKPRKEEDQTAEYVLRKWGQLDMWLETETEKILDKMAGGGTNNRLEATLRKIMDNIKNGWVKDS